MLLQREQNHYLSTGVGEEPEEGAKGVHTNGYARKTAAWIQEQNTFKKLHL